MPQTYLPTLSGVVDDMGTVAHKHGAVADNNGSRPINDTWLNRFLVLAAIKVLGRLRPRQGTVLLLTTRICIKYGRLRHLPEASTMVFITRNTAIPVPKIYCAFKHKDRTYIVMERVRGEAIVQTWRRRSAESKANILKQLEAMVDSMRRLVPPSSAVANADGGRLWDCRLPGKSLDFGPFENIDAFHKYLRCGCDTVSERIPSSVNDLIQFHHGEWPKPVFTHGDLSSLNVMAEGDVVTGIIDWETAGWYPYYWEYTTACQVNFRNLFWRPEVDRFLKPWPTELEYEMIRQKYFGDIPDLTSDAP